MDFLAQPALSPSSCSDNTLIGSPDTPSKMLAEDFITVKLASTSKPPQSSSLFLVENQMFKDPFANGESDTTSIFARSRRNAISAQPSNDDTIVCHGPGFGVVFGNVKGGSGSLNYEPKGFTQKLQSEEEASERTPKRRSNPTPAPPARAGSPSLAFYLSPTYGLPNSPFVFSSVSEGDTFSPSSVFESSDEEDDSVETVQDESEVDSVAVLTRSPASHSLSSFLSGADAEGENAKGLAKLHRRRNARVIEANRQFYDAINRAHARDRLSNTFHLTLPAPLNRQRESSQRVALHNIAMQAAHVASSRRGAGNAVRRQLMSV